MRGLRARPRQEGWKGGRGEGGNQMKKREPLCLEFLRGIGGGGVRVAGGMQLQFVPLTVRGKNGYCLAGEKRIEPL